MAHEVSVTIKIDSGFWINAPSKIKGKKYSKRKVNNLMDEINNFTLLNNFVTNKMVKLNQVITEEREVNIYRNSKICINYHEDTPKHIIYNLRYFKIPFFGGFQLVDSPLKKSPYFFDKILHKLCWNYIEIYPDGVRDIAEKPY